MKVNKSIVCPKFIRAVCRIMVWSLTGGVASQVLADTMPNHADHPFAHWERASDSELDQLRGGFVLPNGVTIDFSLERIISLNGAVVSSSFFELPGNVTLIQNGNIIQDPGLSMSGLGTVIQNNLDNQTISALTQLNLTVSNIREMNLNAGGAIVNNLVLPGM